VPLHEPGGDLNMRAPLTEEQRRRIIEELAQREKFSRKNIMRRHGVSRKTLDRLREMALDAATAPSAK
jgi:DNA-binding NtrC family response regulator